ncbi:MAG TPA: DegV family protein [Coriobacteriia bacterium]|jgi:DegV family protein with EDD domain
MSDVGLVCDSTCDLGPEWLSARGVTMVPLRVHFGDEAYLDWIDLTPDEFYAKLKSSPTLPKTSQPSPADFAAAYQRLASEGAREIVVVTLSSPLSGTYESAMLAAAEAPVPVRVVDSRSASQGTGLVVKAAIEARDAGSSAEEVEAAASMAASEVHLYFVVETLEYLVKGGRAGRAQALAASLLNIKPVLHIGRDGVVEPYKKVKGMRGAIEEMAARIAEDSKTTPMRVSVLWGQRADLVDSMKAALAASGARYEIESVGIVGAVIGTYTGPEVVGIAYHPAR